MASRKKQISRKKRRVGVEIEFTGLPVRKVAEQVAAVLGGMLNVRTDYDIQVQDTQLGDCVVEVDFALLKRLGQARAEAEQKPGVIDQWSEEMLAGLARQVTPCEIVTDPIAFSRVAELDDLMDALRQAGARGTDDALMYAFGVHFNPEVTGLDVADILPTMQAFAILHDWLLIHMQIDPVRRIVPFIRPWPAEYVEQILATDYQPDITTLIDDYLAHNPTRNRALDLLPLFAHIDAERVHATVGDDKTKSRPTYHYRLANCRIGDPQWRLSDEWQQWLLIESLAQDRDKLAMLSDAYRQILGRVTGDWFADWPSQVDRWMKD